MGADENADFEGYSEDCLPMTVKSVFSAYRYVAARSAILRPFSDRAGRTDVVKATDRLRLMYRIRLDALQSAGWNVMEDRKKIRWMRNCPPVGFLLSHKTRCCNKPLVCPFCYARQRVLFPFRKLETALYGATGKYTDDAGKLLGLARPDLKILRFSIVTDGSAGCATPFDSKDGLFKHWEYLREGLNGHRWWEARALKAEYGTVLLKIFPYAKGERLGMIRAGVLLVSEDRLPDVGQLHDYAEAGGRLEVYEPSKKNLCSAMSRAFIYPARMMRADPTVTARLLELMRNTKVQSWYGGPVEPKNHY